MYTRSVDTTATRAGVSCLSYIRCAAPDLCFFRLLLLKSNKPTSMQEWRVGLEPEEAPERPS